MQDVIDQYARFSTPDAPYIIDLVTTLQTMANQAGYTSALDVADFIHVCWRRPIRLRSR